MSSNEEVIKELLKEAAENVETLDTNEFPDCDIEAQIDEEAQAKLFKINCFRPGFFGLRSFNYHTSFTKSENDRTGKVCEKFEVHWGRASRVSIRCHENPKFPNLQCNEKTEPLDMEQETNANVKAMKSKGFTLCNTVETIDKRAYQATCYNNYNRKDYSLFSIMDIGNAILRRHESKRRDVYRDEVDISRSCS